ncbi:MAG TPA: BTAD domain-containing putative transcriptional regulator [Kutzneria sp.]|nr:BTAD domain-containing putative transcriptional regulator [Kutzneria sp.]
MSGIGWEFGVLGPLIVRHDGRTVQLRSTKQQLLLAVLLLRANEPVSADDLVDRLWGEDPPDGARATLQTHVMRLRNSLGDSSLVRTVPGGYSIRIEPEALDLTRFERLRSQARQAERSADTAEEARLLAAALALWRGPAFTGHPTESVRLDERRWEAVERRNEVELRLGRHDAIVDQLRSLVTQQPLRERFWAQLILALHRGGQQAQALDAYRRCGEVLAHELGIDPNAELRALHQAVLGDSAAPIDGPQRPEPAWTPRCELPPAVATLAGRTEDVVRMTHSLRAERDSHRVWMITGPGGVGKTSLAVHVAHLVRSWYPDGQLYLDLRGQERPVEPAEALDRLLRGLGTPGAAIPATLDQRVALYRDRLADRRVLVVLDNAATEAQVRPLLPGTTASAALVTSRAVLAGLESAQVLPLDVLTSGDAVRVLTEALGEARVNAEPAAAEQLVDYCGRLPLALRVAAARLVARPHWRLTQLVARLSDERRRLDELRFGDLDVRASLTLSYRELSEPQQRAFRLLARLDTPDFPAWVAAPLLGVDPDTAEDHVEALVDARLVDTVGWDALGQTRYRLHDLLRVFGRDLGDVDDAPLVALMDQWVALVECADHKIAQRGPRLPGGDAGVLGERLLADPTGWFDTEWTTLGGVITQCVALGLAEQTTRLAVASAAVCDLRARFDDWEHDNRLGLDAAVGATPAEAILVQQRGLLHSRRHRFAEAQRDFTRSKDVFEYLGDADGAGYAWHGIGWMHEWLGRQTEAKTCHEMAMRRFEAAGNRHGQVDVLCSLGAIERRAGRSSEAEAYLRQARGTAAELGDRMGMLSAALELGRVLQARGELSGAVEHIHASLTDAHRLGDPDLVANLRLTLAETYLRMGAKDTARTEVQQALMFFEEHDDLAGKAWAWRLLSWVGLLANSPESALALAERAVATTESLGLPQEHARALRQLGRVLHEAGKPEDAALCWRQAEKLLDDAGFHAEAAEIRAHSGTAADGSSV